MQSRIQTQVPEVHVWTLPIPTVVESIDRHPLFSLLSRPEQERILGAGSEEYRTQYLFSHALARLKIAERFDMPPHDVPLLFAPGAKPRLLEKYRGCEWHLSLSHTGGMTAVAFASQEVGVDVEPIGRVAHLDDVARRMFHPDEAAEIAALTGDEKKRRFTQYWTLREAFFKASGMTLSEMREGVVFKVDDWNVRSTLRLLRQGSGQVRSGQAIHDHRSPITDHRSPPPSWHFTLAHPAPDHILALAVASGEEVGVEFHKVGIEELI